MTSINDVEMLTGIDFFSQLPDEIEDEIESQINPNRWLYDNERFNMRTSIWNKGAN